MRFVLKQMHMLHDGKFVGNNSALRVLHIIGTPGFGKSSCFYIAKVIQDIRIRHVIKNGCPADSIFGDNCKIFYFLATTSAISIMKQMSSEVKLDFGQLP